MSRIRRTRYLLFTCQDRLFLDVALLVRGVAEPTRTSELLALSILTGEEFPLTSGELDALVAIPTDWIDVDRVDTALAETFARRGLVVTDSDDAELAELRRRDERLAADHWNLYAAFYHFMTKWRDVGLTFDVEQPDDEYVKSLGAAPPAFHTVDADVVTDLPVVGRDGDLYELLLRRRTTRAFDASRPLTQEQLAVLLRYVWGCHGTLAVSDDVVSLKKTSPSGGGLHPTEVYPLVLNVDGLQPGLYHYDVERHALESMQPLSLDEARELASEMTVGQHFPPDAAVVFLMTTRFPRHFWKYRGNNRAYGVLLMDAAHLSQTFYLVATELGLGAFVTAAINAHNIEEQLGLDGFAEAPVAVCGAGHPLAVPNAAEPQFEPFVPRAAVAA